MVSHLLIFSLFPVCPRFACTRSLCLLLFLALLKPSKDVPPVSLPISDFLGRTEVPVATIKKELENKGAVTRRLLLHEVPTGEVWVRLDLQLFGNK